MTVKLILSVIAIIISLMMLYINYINYKKKLLNKFNYLIWTFIWSLVIGASLRPKIIDIYFINNYQIDIFYILSVISIITLIILYYLNLIKINILEKKINNLIRAESLKNVLDKTDEK